MTPDPLYDGYRYNGEADDTVEVLTMIGMHAECEPPLHRYDVDANGKVAAVCRCGLNPRRQMA